MSLQADKAVLMVVAKELASEWEHTKEHWHDAKSIEFERKYLDALHANLNMAASTIEKLDALINRVRKECE